MEDAMKTSDLEYFTIDRKDEYLREKKNGNTTKDYVEWLLESKKKEEKAGIKMTPELYAVYQQELVDFEAEKLEAWAKSPDIPLDKFPKADSFIKWAKTMTKEERAGFAIDRRYEYRLSFNYIGSHLPPINQAKYEKWLVEQRREEKENGIRLTPELYEEYSAYLREWRFSHSRRPIICGGPNPKLSSYLMWFIDHKSEDKEEAFARYLEIKKKKLQRSGNGTSHPEKEYALGCIPSEGNFLLKIRLDKGKGR